MPAPVGSGGLGQKLPPFCLIGWCILDLVGGLLEYLGAVEPKFNKKKPKKIIKGPKRGGTRKMDPLELASEPPRSHIGAASNSAPHLTPLGWVMLGVLTCPNVNVSLFFLFLTQFSS